MKNEEFFELLEDVDENLIDAARSPVPKRGRRLLFGIGTMAACLTLAIIGHSLLTGNEPILKTNGVTISYTDQTTFSTSEYQLIYLTEEELFTHFNTAVFKGTVTEIQNIQLDFAGDKNYRALAKIQVEHTYRGSCEPGQIVTVLLPCPITDRVWVEDTETISVLEVGMTGIFMPIIYDEDDYWEQNGATLILRDVADYGFADGMRYAFLETDSGLFFARHAYPSIKDASTLADIEGYVITMIEKYP